MRRKLRKTIDKGARIKQYFLRGHNAWFVLVFSLMNFTLIFYDLLFIDLDFIPSYLKSYSTFLVVFGLIYFPTATILGFLDFKKGSYAAEVNLQREVNPIQREMFQRLDKIEADNKKIIEYLSKLVESN